MQWAGQVLIIHKLVAGQAWWVRSFQFQTWNSTSNLKFKLETQLQTAFIITITIIIIRSSSISSIIFIAERTYDQMQRKQTTNDSVLTMESTYWNNLNATKAGPWPPLLSVVTYNAVLYFSQWYKGVVWKTIERVFCINNHQYVH